MPAQATSLIKTVPGGTGMEVGRAVGVSVEAAVGVWLTEAAGSEGVAVELAKDVEVCSRLAVRVGEPGGVAEAVWVGEGEDEGLAVAEPVARGVSDEGMPVGVSEGDVIIDGVVDRDATAALLKRILALQDRLRGE